jgi:hypothetical protein
MIAPLKALVGRLLFQDRSKTKFIASRLSPNEISEKVFLLNDKYEAEITWEHCIVCHSPFYVAVWAEDRLPASADARLQVRKNGKVQTAVALKLNQEIEFHRHAVLVYEIINASCYQLPYWRQYILQKRYFLYKKKDTFLQGMAYAAMYSFPRRVITVSYKEDGYFNIFPMDFQCFIERSNTMLLGLRTTNTTLGKMLAMKRVVIADTTSVDLKTVYDLGRNHSASPPTVDELPFGVIKSERFQFYVPDFSAAYREFEIVKHFELGTHTMMIATAVNSVKLRNDQSYIHHLHFFEFVNSDYVEASDL